MCRITNSKPQTHKNTPRDTMRILQNRNNWQAKDNTANNSKLAVGSAELNLHQRSSTKRTLRSPLRSHPPTSAQRRETKEKKQKDLRSKLEVGPYASTDSRRHRLANIVTVWPLDSNQSGPWRVYYSKRRCSALVTSYHPFVWPRLAWQSRGVSFYLHLRGVSLAAFAPPACSKENCLRWATFHCPLFFALFLKVLHDTPLSAAEMGQMWGSWRPKVGQAVASSQESAMAKARQPLIVPELAKRRIELEEHVRCPICVQVVCPAACLAQFSSCTAEPKKSNQASRKICSCQTSGIKDNAEHLLQILGFWNLLEKIKGWTVSFVASMSHSQEHRLRFTAASIVKSAHAIPTPKVFIWKHTNLSLSCVNSHVVHSSSL